MGEAKRRRQSDLGFGKNKQLLLLADMQKQIASVPELWSLVFIYSIGGKCLRVEIYQDDQTVVKDLFKKASLLPEDVLKKIDDDGVVASFDRGSKSTLFLCLMRSDTVRGVLERSLQSIASDFNKIKINVLPYADKSSLLENIKRQEQACFLQKR